MHTVHALPIPVHTAQFGEFITLKVPNITHPISQGWVWPSVLLMMLVLLTVSHSTVPGRETKGTAGCGHDAREHPALTKLDRLLSGVVLLEDARWPTPLNWRYTTTVVTAPIAHQHTCIIWGVDLQVEVQWILCSYVVSLLYSNWTEPFSIWQKEVYSYQNINWICM